MVGIGSEMSSGPMNGPCLQKVSVVRLCPAGRRDEG